MHSHSAFKTIQKILDCFNHLHQHYLLAVKQCPTFFDPQNLNYLIWELANFLSFNHKLNLFFQETIINHQLYQSFANNCIDSKLCFCFGVFQSNA